MGTAQPWGQIAPRSAEQWSIGADQLLIPMGGRHLIQMQNAGKEWQIPETLQTWRFETKACQI
jgi:hypothetical protein